MYSDTTWNNRVLIPLWSAHLVIVFCLVAVLAVDMMEYAGDHDGENNRYAYWIASTASTFLIPSNSTLTAFMFFIMLALLMSPLEMVLQSYRYLEPWVYLGFQVYKAVISTIFVVILGVLFTEVDKSGIAYWITIINIILIAFTVLAT